MNHDVWWVYLIRCADDTLYCGITVDMEKRMAAHSDGTGAKYTRGRGPFEIEALIGPMSQGQALRAEARIKRLPREKKLTAFSEEMGCWETLPDSYRVRSRTLHLATAMVTLASLSHSLPFRHGSLTPTGRRFGS